MITLRTGVLVFLYRLHSTHYDIVKVIGTNLHNLEELILGELDLNYDDAIKFLVRGCPKLRILHVGRGVTLKSVEYLLLGLHNLMEFKHPLMTLALANIIILQNGNADIVSSLRTLYIDEKYLLDFNVTDDLKSAQTVMNHLINITKLVITTTVMPCKELLTTFSVTVPTMIHLTELTWREFSCDDTIVPILEDVGHQLILLDLRCKDHFSFDVIDQCRKLRVLRIANETRNKKKSYGSNLNEQFTAFQYLEELHLSTLNNSHLKPALFKSLIASPVLRDLNLVRIPIFTDDILEAAFNHVNQDGEQLSFTSLRKLELHGCHFIKKYLENMVSHERVPLEFLTIQNCLRLTERHLWNLQRFDMEVIDLNCYNYCIC